MFDKNIYITTTLPYVNSIPHIGHTFEFVLADFIARIHRYKFGKENVFFNTGVDEHGQKIHQRALDLNKDPQKYCDEITEKWLVFCKKFNISYDNFYRTTSPVHKHKALQYFSDFEKDDVYKNNYNGLYCEGCESFKTNKEIKSNHCELHPTLELKNISEENYFFKLSKYALTCVSNDILIDETLLSELHHLIKTAEDISISRENVSWGIPIPETNQTIYVWTEALLNYIFAAGYNPYYIKPHSEFLKWWHNSLIICGKDNLRFQALILPALLASQNIPAPSKVLVHGTIVDEEGKKMSKSTGNIIDPIEQLDKFGINPLRYYLIAGLNTFQDSSFSEKELVNKYNADISNGFGNLLARTLHLIDLKQIEINKESGVYQEHINKLVDRIWEKLDKLHIKDAFEEVNYLISFANKLVTETKPYSEDCPNPDAIINDLFSIIEHLSPIYNAVFPDKEEELNKAILSRKKTILFEKIKD